MNRDSIRIRTRRDGWRDVDIDREFVRAFIAGLTNAEETGHLEMPRYRMTICLHTNYKPVAAATHDPVCER